MIRGFIVLSLMLLMAGCKGQKNVSEEELNAYILEPSHGLRKHHEKNGMNLEVLYRPTELIIAQQLRGVIDHSERSRIIKNFDTLSYFTVKLSRQGQEIENNYVGDPQKFASVVRYLSSELARDIYLINDGDTLVALDAVYSRMFGSATATSVMVVFESNLKERDGETKFCFYDTELGLGQNEVVFDLSDIRKIPTLKLN